MTSRAGTAEASARLKIEKKSVKPNFVNRFSDLEVKKGESAMYWCKVDGEPRPTIQWFHNRKPLVVC